MAFGSSKQNNISALAIAVASALTVSASAVQAQEEAAVEEKDVEKVVVTGSRVAQDSSLEAASPVLAINAGDIKTSGQIDLGAMLRESPQLQASLPGSFSAFNGTPLGPVDLCCTYFTQQYIGSHIIENASDTILA